MIRFLSLYLGLLTGLQPVELIVSPEVVKVEVALDGAAVGTLSAEPWRLEVDFGSRLVPRRLAAVAYGGDGGEIGRAEQLINLPRPAAEVGVVLERDEAGKVVAARLSWQSRGRAQPAGVSATLDGAPLAVTDPQRIPIPSHDPKDLHILIVELRFSSRDRVQAVTSFGGASLDEVRTELTALPVVSTRRRPPSPAELEGAVQRAGKALTVVSVDQGPAEVLFVRDTAAAALIEEIGSREASGVGGFGASGPTGVATSAAEISGVAASAGEQLQRMLTLGPEDRIRLMWPVTRRVERPEVRMELFPASPPFTAADGGVYWALTQKVMLDKESEVQRLADALAVAGVEAVAENRRRAVVLVLGPGPADASRYRPDNVRAYLQTLRVPLHVWAVGLDEGAPALAGWGEVERISSLRGLQRAVRKLEKDLERQAILWVDGQHLPQELELAPNAGVLPVNP